MQKRKSARHQIAARVRWRAAEARAEAERAAGLGDREPDTDARMPFALPLAAAGYRDLHIEPRLGYIAWRALDSRTGQVLHCCALKTMLHEIAGKLPRTLGKRAQA